MQAYVSVMGRVKMNKHYKELDFSQIDANIVRCPDSEHAAKIITEIEKIKESRNSFYTVKPFLQSFVKPFQMLFEILLKSFLTSFSTNLFLNPFENPFNPFKIIVRTLFRILLKNHF